MEDWIIGLRVEKYQLELRSAFGTSHSSTTNRTNAIIRIEVEGGCCYRGVGEVGLPPKKKGCYLADYDDVEGFFNQYKNIVVGEWKRFGKDFDQGKYKEWMNLELFKEFLTNPELREVKRKEEAIPWFLLQLLHSSKFTDHEGGIPKYKNAATCGIEMAIFDLWGSILQKPLYQILNLSLPTSKVSFYTAALNDDLKEIEKSAEFGLKHTPHLKIKLDSNLDKGITILTRLLTLYLNLPNSSKQPVHWSVDANSAWEPQTALEFLNNLQSNLPSFLPYFYMLEQPFGVDLEQVLKQKEQWKKVKTEYEKQGVLVYADESVSTFEQIPMMKDLVHGVNIKLEKAGGILGALKAVKEAEKHGLKVWLGCMVSSRVSCSCSAHLLSLSSIGGDLDGDLLVKEESELYEGGFAWGTGGVAVIHPTYFGIGVREKKTNLNLV